MTGYVGSQCQTDVDDCDLRKPCENGGVCYDLVNDYLCICQNNDYAVSHVFPLLLLESLL